MSRDFEMNVNGRLRDALFALQLDESTDASGKCQVLAFLGLRKIQISLNNFCFTENLQ
jgi:hypothetical protein